ncbi:hypothetical protein [Altererythrobacter litoralis]|uniref:Uncharacterized protein n=1 Tax=Altererythrobacter litoralis TaxID=3113904 RepID=A0ABU7GBZ2_9SPHN|nr:hypothetical protein [Erythrobacteraceae bacterium 1XM1-14]
MQSRGLGRVCSPLRVPWPPRTRRKEKTMTNVAEKLFSLIAAISLSGLMFNATIV